MRHERTEPAIGARHVRWVTTVMREKSGDRTVRCQPTNSLPGAFSRMKRARAKCGLSAVSLSRGGGRCFCVCAPRRQVAVHDR